MVEFFIREKIPEILSIVSGGELGTVKLKRPIFQGNNDLEVE
jgi:hypothetical protein